MPHLNYTECVQIQVLLEEGYSHRSIAVRLCRSNRAISQEIKKYGYHEKYTAGVARTIRKTKRSVANTLLHTKIKPNSELEQYILEKIKTYRSPEQIAGRRYKKTGKTISKDTIYSYMYRNYPKMIKKYFRRKGKKYVHKRDKIRYILDRKSIHERPVVEGGGHWEGDTMWGRKRKGGFATFNEIESGYLLAGPLVERKAPQITKKAQELFQRIPESLKKTMTLDNGREFVEHFMMKPLCGLETYFADPGNPGQRGANENTNGLLRQRYPKGADLGSISQSELDYYVGLLNNRPRKKLNYMTPIEFLASRYCVLLD